MIHPVSLIDMADHSKGTLLQDAANQWQKPRSDESHTVIDIARFQRGA